MYAGLFINGTYIHKRYNDSYFSAFVPISNNAYGKPVLIDLDSGDQQKISNAIIDWCHRTPLSSTLYNNDNNPSEITIQSILVSKEKLYHDNTFIGGEAIIFNPDYNRIPLHGNISINNTRVDCEYFSSKGDKIIEFISLYNDTLTDEVELLSLEYLIDLLSQENPLEAFAPYISLDKPSIQKLDTLNALGKIITDLGFQKEESFEWDEDRYYSDIDSDDLLSIHNQLVDKGFSSF